MNKKTAKFLKKIIIYITFAILLFIQASPIFAQADKIEPEAGIGKNYFVEGEITDANFVKIDEIKAELKNLNELLKGVWIEKKTQEKEYKECVEWHDAKAKEALDFKSLIAVKPKKPAVPVKKAAAKPASTAATNTATTSINYDTSIYYTAEKCFYTGYTDDFQFYQNMYKKVGCDLNKITNELTDAKIAAIVKKQELDTTDKDTKYIIDQLKAEIKKKTTTTTTSTVKPTSDDIKRQEKCEYYYFDWYFALKNAELTLKEIKEKNQELSKYQNPELFACQYKTGADGTTVEINNKLCVEFTERLGSTRVIGAKSGIGLLKAYLALIYRYAAILVGVAAVLMIIISGIQIAVGGEEAVTKAKERLVNAIIGIAVLFLSGAILYIINPNFFTY
ncbi:pilin [Patescibacteria group bacterium]|nr:pilin [Patescibacteria group bacterium]